MTKELGAQPVKKRGVKRAVTAGVVMAAIVAGFVGKQFMAASSPQAPSSPPPPAAVQDGMLGRVVDAATTGAEMVWGAEPPVATFLTDNTPEAVKAPARGL